MQRREIREILAAHADKPDGLQGWGFSPSDQVRGLLDLAEQLRGILVPVEAGANFRRRLHGELVLEAQRRQAQPQASLFRQHRKGILIGAAAVGSVASVVGVVLAFVLRYRHGRMTRTATG